MKSKKKKTLYYVDSPFPTKKQSAKAEELGASFRNASMVKESSKLEPCDAVAGCAPKGYAKEVERIDTSEADAKEKLTDKSGGTSKPPSK